MEGEVGYGAWGHGSVGGGAGGTLGVPGDPEALLQYFIVTTLPRGNFFFLPCVSLHILVGLYAHNRGEQSLVSSVSRL